MFSKPIEYWAVLAGMVIYVATRDAEREPLVKRLAKTAASAFLTVGLSPSVAPYVRGSEVLAAVAIMSVGLIVLDVLTAMVRDRDFLKDMIRKKLGGGK
ncbi:hypothetical protein [Thioclava sp. GXIMD2076]|uniref:Holin n=1 Tax=Thioclava kandeliae TaxID=3070818 RepID=A0ABV1SN26_9RHOB